MKMAVMPARFRARANSATRAVASAKSKLTERPSCVLVRVRRLDRLLTRFSRDWTPDHVDLGGGRWPMWPMADDVASGGI
eukprot:6115960-Prymnesium_polylepis.1